MDRQRLYRDFCLEHERIPIFFEPWFLDAVCPNDSWDAALAYNGDRIIGVMPYQLTTSFGFRKIQMPMLCRHLGPLLVEDLNFGKHIPRIYKALIDDLPRFDVYEQAFHYGIQNHLPFLWKGFRSQNLFSYILTDIQDLETVYNAISSDYRQNKMRPALEKLTCSEAVGIGAFIEIHRMTYTRAGLHVPVSDDYIRRLDGALVAADRRAILGIRDDDGRLHSAAYVVWDAEAAYYLMAGDDPELRKSGSAVLLMWHAVRFAADVLKKSRFDFLGSMTPQIAKVRRQFGARPVKYYYTTRYPTIKGKVYYGLRTLLKGTK